MNIYYIKVSKIVSDIFEVKAENKEDAIDIIKTAINNDEICTSFFNNSEYIFDFIEDESNLNNKNITSI